MPQRGTEGGKIEQSIKRYDEIWMKNEQVKK
jgi:hypothetical protein